MSMRPFTRRQFLSSTGAVAATAGFPGIGRAQEDSVLRIRHKKDIQNLDPLHNPDVTERNVKSGILVKLISYKSSSDWEWELDAAQSIEQVDPTHITFTLRPGIKWTNGYGEVTAEDVKFSFERIADPANESPWRSEWAQLERVDVTDRFSGVIVLKQPSATLWRLALPYTGGEIVCKKAVEDVGGQFSTEPPATCGPYLYTKWIPNQRLILTRNPDWNGPEVEFDEVHFLPITDEKAAENALLAGEIDITDIAISSIAQWREDLPAGITLDVRSRPGLEWIGMNTAHEPFDDIRVRQAVQKAIDVNLVLEAGYFGQAQAATGLIPKGFPAYREQGPYGTRDVDGARELLAAAGYSNGFKTRIALINTADLTTMAQVVQANLAEVGIELEIDAMEGGRFWSLGLESKGDEWKDLQMVLQRWGNGPDPDMTTRWYTCEQVGKWNWERWCNEEYSALNADAAVATNESERAALYARMADLLDQSAAYVLLAYGATAVAYRDGIVPGLTADAGRYLLPAFRRTQA